MTNMTVCESWCVILLSGLVLGTLNHCVLFLTLVIKFVIFMVYIVTS